MGSWKVFLWENAVLFPWGSLHQAEASPSGVRFLFSFSIFFLSLLKCVCVKFAQLYLTLCNSMDYSPPGSSVHGNSPGKNTGVGCHFLLQCMEVKSERKSLSRVWLFATPCTAAYQAPPSMGLARQEYWSGVPLPSPKINLCLHKNVHSTVTCNC